MVNRLYCLGFSLGIPGLFGRCNLCQNWILIIFVLFEPWSFSSHFFPNFDFSEMFSFTALGWLTSTGSLYLEWKRQAVRISLLNYHNFMPRFISLETLCTTLNLGRRQLCSSYSPTSPSFSLLRRSGSPPPSPLPSTPPSTPASPTTRTTKTTPTQWSKSSNRRSLASFLDFYFYDAECKTAITLA